MDDRQTFNSQNKKKLKEEDEARVCGVGVLSVNN